jgi:hypothetical protein
VADWSKNPDNMKTASWVLLTQGSVLSSHVANVANAMRRTESSGPVFSLLDSDLQRVASRLRQAGTGLRNVGQRLLNDAEAEIAQRRFEEWLKTVNPFN